MRFSILHTSARPDKWRMVYDAWIAAADHPENIEYVLVCDRRWGFTELPSLGDGIVSFKPVWNTGRRCYVDGVNIAAQYATGDILIVNADDQFPCEHWDTELIKVLNQDFKPKDDQFVIEVSTNTPAEHDRGILVMPILSRARYERQGHVLYPAYESMYSDNDFCEHARKDGIIINARHLVFPHKHPIFDQSQPWDAAYEQQNRQEAYDLGLAVLEKRRESNFGDVSVQYKAEEKKIFACVLPGENFSQAWVGAWTELLTNLMAHFHVHAQFGFTSNVYFTRLCMFDALKHIAPRPDYILWLDDDQILTLDGLRNLVRDLEEHPEIDIVSGWAWCEANIYGHTPMLSCGIYDAAGKPKRLEHGAMMAGPDELIDVSYSGFPAVLMRGGVLEKLGGKAFLPIMDAELFPPFGMSGEDTAFFIHAHEVGLKCVVDRRVKVPHLKLRCAEPVEASSLEPVEKK